MKTITTVADLQYVKFEEEIKCKIAGFPVIYLKKVHYDICDTCDDCGLHNICKNNTTFQSFVTHICANALFVKINKKEETMCTSELPKEVKSVIKDINGTIDAQANVLKDTMQKAILAAYNAGVTKRNEEFDILNNTLCKVKEALSSNTYWAENKCKYDINDHD